MKNLGVRVTGFLIFLLSLTGMIATILLSIAKNISDLSTITLANLAYIFTVCFAGLAIFSANCYITAIRKQYYSHYNKIVFLRTGLLVFMVYNNYHFFMNNMQISTTIDKVMYFLLCVLIDFGIITLLPFAFDRMLLNYTYKNSNDDISTLSKLVNILFFRWKLKIDLQYQKNLQLMNNPVIDTANKIQVSEIVEEKPSNFDQGKDTIKELTYKQDSNVKEPLRLIQGKDVLKLKTAILNYKDENICPPVAALEQLTGFTKNRIYALKKVLENEGFIETVNKQTIVKEGV